MKTRAAVLYEQKKPLKIEELLIPELKGGQVLVKIAVSGICHSQLNEIMGLKGPDRFLPHTLGHEGAGVVQAIGQGVKKVRPGDRVVLTWIKGNGIDVPSTTYHSVSGSCVNSGAISTFMEYSVVSESRLVSIPKEMPLKEAALLGCAIPTGAGIVLNNTKIDCKSSVAVFGAGGIGQSAILAARLMDAATIIAVDVSEERLGQASRLGAKHVINAKERDPLETILEITSGQGVDYAIEAAGKREAMETAFQVVRDNGGLCILAGNLPKGERIAIDPFDLIRGKRIIGTWGGQTHPDRDIPLYIDLYLKKKFDIGALVTKEYRLDDINIAFQDMEIGKEARALVRMDNEGVR